MDDIVTRLRAYDIGDIARESCYHMTEVLGEAADEIKRLRKALVHQLSIADMCFILCHCDYCKGTVKSSDNPCPDCEYAMKLYNEASGRKCNYD